MAALFGVYLRKTGEKKEPLISKKKILILKQSNMFMMIQIVLK
jgi:hypothetical protein